MIMMALDHTRDFFHYDAFMHDPLDLHSTTGYLFFTRWITHYCAPVFVFLAGTSIYLQQLRKYKKELSTFLFKRGLWLIFIELIIITFSFTFDFHYKFFIMQVIWAIGISMVFMSLVVRLPYKIILSLGLLIVFGHNIFDYIESTHHGFLWDLTRNGHFATYEILPGRKFAIAYPFVPWFGLMMLGFCFGKIYEPSFDSLKRKKILLRAGIGVILFFIVLRFLNVYGNPEKWSVQSDWFVTLLSFIDTHKYPPSLLYICMTIGPALIFLSLFENSNSRISRIISVYGRVPFFYYVLHFYMLHTICMILFVTRGHSFSEVIPPINGIPFQFMIAGEGYSLKIVYVIWLSVVIALYPLCKWFSEYKKKNKSWWLSYL